MLNRFLFKHIDNSALIVFRIIFGLLIFSESVGAIFTGWVKRTLIDPEFTFSFIGFEWLQPLPGNWMYVYYAIMGVFGFCVMIGYKYRFSIIAFTILWTATYLMQKASYNNHYYFLCLLSVVMIFLPANTCYSVDAKQNPHIKSNSMPRWSALILMFNIFLVYTYGSIAKMYPDWLDTSVFELLMKSKQHYFIIGDLLQQKWLHYFLAYGGILFDGLIIPLLLFKPTRKWAFIISVFFHLFNSIVFQVGIFPYLSLAFAVFFFEPRTIQKLFLKKKHFYDNAEVIIPKYKTPLLIILSGYLIVQLLLPLRHHLIQDNVLWTEEGHRMSWRMMLRTKGGIVKYKVIDKSNYSEIPVKLSDYLSEKQSVIASTKPDVIWQFAQYLKKDFKAKGIDVEVYVNCKISVNGKPLKQLIDPEIDLASVKWNAFKHSDWILPSKQD
ncbi:MAG: HTTM domain-containing protein [Bacteroidetes bacterium]|nr:HTTM domain-containing protein [Bacteroidota bacterium]